MMCSHGPIPAIAGESLATEVKEAGTETGDGMVGMTPAIATSDARLQPPIGNSENRAKSREARSKISIAP